MIDICYYSSSTENTKSFVERVCEKISPLQKINQIRIPIKMMDDNFVYVDKPYILFIPTYAAGDGRGALPKSIVKFLNNEKNRDLIRGVIASGNINFGDFYCYGGYLISNKCNVPLLYKYELRGTEKDVINVSKLLLKEK